MYMLEGLWYCMHQWVLDGNELLDLGVGLFVGIASLAVAVVPCVHWHTQSIKTIINHHTNDD
jgi:hypothetical protein